MSGRSVIRYFLFDVSFAIIIGLILGFIITQLFLGVSLTLLALLLWYCYQTKHILNWITQTKSLYPPRHYSFFSLLADSLTRAKKNERNKVKALIDSVKQFKTGAESLPDALIVLDQDYKITWCNQISQFELGIRWPNDKGQHITNLLRYPILTRYLNDELFDKPLTLLSHQKRQIEIRILPYLNNEWIMLIRDIDHLYLAEQQRQDFFANVSHELKTPLTVIKGYLELYEESPPTDPEAYKTLSDTLLRQTNKMDNLITQILLLSKIENAPLSNNLDTIEMSSILMQIKDDVMQCYPTYQFDFQIENNLNLKGIKEQLHSTVSNLIYNAISHNPEKTLIKVEWKKTEAGAYFSVTDNGIGIESHHIHRLTERFYQVEESRSENHHSTGLGLAIVKHALLNHGNTGLMIKSEINKGSQFYFTIPEKFIL